MKKLAAIFLSLLLALAAAGCGRDAGSSSLPEPLPEPAPSVSSHTEPSIPDNPTRKAAKNNAAIKASNITLIQLDEPRFGDTLAVIKTTAGEITVRLFGGEVPKTVEAFTGLVNSGFYNGQSFDSIIGGYKIESGVFSGSRRFPKDPEYSLNLWNFRGAVSLSDNGSDFMIVQAPQCLNPKAELEALNFPKKVIDAYIDNGGAPHQDWKNTVFGHVVEGMDVVDQIATADIIAGTRPEEPVIITEINITKMYNKAD